MEKPTHQPKPYFSDIMILTIWMPLVIVAIALAGSYLFPLVTSIFRYLHFN